MLMTMLMLMLMTMLMAMAMMILMLRGSRTENGMRGDHAPALRIQDMIQPMTAKVPSRPSHTAVRACLRQFRRRTCEHRRASCLFNDNVRVG